MSKAEVMSKADGRFQCLLRLSEVFSSFGFPDTTLLVFLPHSHHFPVSFAGSPSAGQLLNVR